ncbi:hypothetical protein BGZ60DRAFT_6159 [Tricladium varicosporioides]|nr:hypothetical protein BGZ60DRAFT_6159 [Hymenoscyphus varicosporioides]
MTVPISQEEVLSTVELLEAIFLQLPLQDLLVNAQRVNRTWKEQIKTSVALQQKLFFQSWPENGTGEFEHNSLLEGIFLPWLSGIEPRGATKPRHQHNHYESFENMKWAATGDSRKAVLRKDASWRRMFPMQPPPRYLNVVKYCHDQLGDVTLYGEAHFSSGLRMGSLYDFVEEQVSIPITSFAIIWHDRDREKFEGGNEKSRETTEVILHYTVQCCDIDDERLTQSEGYEEVKIELKEDLGHKPRRIFDDNPLFN